MVTAKRDDKYKAEMAILQAACDTINYFPRRAASCKLRGRRPLVKIVHCDICGGPYPNQSQDASNGDVNGHIRVCDDPSCIKIRKEMELELRRKARAGLIGTAASRAKSLDALSISANALEEIVSQVAR